MGTMKSNLRIVGCVASLCGIPLSLASAAWYAWMTVAGHKEQLDEHRLGFYLCLVAALLCYVVFSVLLRPKNVLLYLFNSLVVCVWSASLLAVDYFMTAKVLLVLASVYLLWRGVAAVRKSSERQSEK